MPSSDIYNVPRTNTTITIQELELNSLKCPASTYANFELSQSLKRLSVKSVLQPSDDPDYVPEVEQDETPVKEAAVMAMRHNVSNESLAKILTVHGQEQGRATAINEKRIRNQKKLVCREARESNMNLDVYGK